MNLLQVKELLENHPREWSLEEDLEFREYSGTLGYDIPDEPATSDFGKTLHLARSWADFKYFSAVTMDYGWKEKRNPATGAKQFYGFMFGDPEWPHHDEMADFLVAQHEKIQILAPRGSYKTTLLSLYAVWRIGRMPDIRMMYAMDVLKNAIKVVNSLMLEMERECYIEIFGQMKPPPKKPGWAKTGLRVAQCKRTSKEPTVTPGGVDSSITGDHQDLILLDDIVTETNTRSREMMLKTYEWTKNLEPILDPGCRLIDNGTRWHHADAHGMFIKENEEIVDEEMKWVLLRVSAERDNGKPAFKHLDEKKLNAARGKGSYFYSCQYLNNPVSTEDQLFFKSQFKIIQFNDIPKRLWLYLLVDTATTTNNQSCKTAIWCVGVDQIGNVYCLDLIQGKWKPDKVINELYGMWFKWKPRWVTMESNVHGKVYCSYIQTQNRIRQTSLKVREIAGRNEKSKDQRIIALQPLFEYGEIWFVNSIPWEMIHEEGGAAEGVVVEQLTTFPKGIEKDIADALADVVVTDREGKVCPPYIARRGIDDDLDVGPNISQINGQYPSDVHRRAAIQHSRFQGRPAGSDSRYRGRPSVKTPRR